MRLTTVHDFTKCGELRPAKNSSSSLKIEAPFLSEGKLPEGVALAVHRQNDDCFRLTVVVMSQTVEPEGVPPCSLASELCRSWRRMDKFLATYAAIDSTSVATAVALAQHAHIRTSSYAP
ncbi:unnamed protein product [Mesocestoides corti]|uniref:Uncharacterized protein n=1 Tax=Mesocestoides corti TaxID=53468 RepID=A0A0R3UA95_MESCO|nr:unnamed protein product [Mesocestoides corti]